jgi:hypothetical protein
MPIEPIPNNPVVNLGEYYVNGLDLLWKTVNTVNLNPGMARDSTGTCDIVLPATVTISGLVVGVNGMDQAVQVASTLYNIYVINDSKGYYPTAGIFSLASNNGPYLPFGYDSYRRVGSVLTNSSNQMIRFYQTFSNSQTRYYWFDGPQLLGQATPGSTTYVNAVLGGVTGSTPATNPNPLFVPPIAAQVFLAVVFTPIAAGNSVTFLPYPSVNGGVGLVSVSGSVAGVAQSAGISIPFGVDIVDYPSTTPVPCGVVKYKTTSASDIVTLSVSGYLDIL